MPRGGSWHSSPPIMSPPLLIILLPIITLTLLFLTVPPLLSATSHVLRPTSVVKNSWDSLNILLVVLAILVGVFARRNDDESSPHQPHQEETVNDAVARNNVRYDTMSSKEEAGGYVSQQWFGFSEERKVHDATPIRFQSPATGVTRLRRNSSSYPDLRHWEMETGDDRYKFRFFDDFEIDKFRSTPPRNQVPAVVDPNKLWPEVEELEEDRVKEIPMDTFEISSSSPPPLPPKSSAPPPPPPPPPRRKPRRTHQKVNSGSEITELEDIHNESRRVRIPPPAPPPPPPPRRKPRRTHQKVECGSEITEHDVNEFTRIRTPPPAPPPPPTPPSVKMRSEHKHRKSKVKREIAMVWASVLSNQRKRKKMQRTKSDHNHNYDNVDELTNNTTAPPPPPPPPPPSVFQSLFRKGLGKSKKIHSVTNPPPPPPPPPLTSSRRWSKRSSQVPPQPPTPPPMEPLRRRNSGRPPMPNKVSNFKDETINNAGNQSPLIPVPPPLPPFKMPAMRFVVRGDFVKIRSNHSSLCSSPEREDIDGSSTIEVSNATTIAAATTVMDNGEVGGSVFCASPDVNIKAATFIAKLRGKWKLEKINSMKEKGNGNGPLLNVTSYNL